MKQYTVNEIFWSPQGEGMRAGQMSVFVRLTGCNLKCRMEEADDSPGGFDCDTEFASGRKMTTDEIVSEAVLLVGKRSDWYEINSAWGVADVLVFTCCYVPNVHDILLWNNVYWLLVGNFV